MPKTETAAEPSAVPSALLQKEAAIDQAIDAWLVSVANDGTDLALRRAAIHGDRLKASIHTILEEI